jgi:4-amino-4-deoxy-L-arabinose transferase-like glycosyltransferase
MPTPLSPERGWAAPAAVALALRLALFAPAAAHPERLTIDGDSLEYVMLAQNLAAGHGFSLAERPPYNPDVRRTPVFPSVLAGVATIAGRDLRVAAMFGLLCSVAAIVVVAALAARLFGDAAGRLAGFLLAIDLSSATYATQVLTEPLFTVLMLLAVLASVDRRRGDATTGASAGVLAGLAALCRPIGLFLAAALLPAAWWRARGDRRRTATVLVMAAVVSAAAAGAWTLRNARVSGVATFTSQVATNAYFHRAAYVAARLEHRRVEDVRDQWMREFEASSGGWSQAQRIAWMNEHGRTLILSHPLVYAAAFAAGIARMFKPDRDILPALLGVAHDSSTWSVISVVAWAQLAIVYALAACGTWILLKRSAATAFVPLGLVVYFLFLAGPEMYPRFRVPVMPALCMLAAAALSPVGVPPRDVGVHE